MNDKICLKNNKNKIRLATLILCASFITSSCNLTNKVQSKTKQISVTQQNISAEDKEKVRKEFVNITDKYFKEIVSLDFTLLAQNISDTNKYGLGAEFPKLTDYSSENINKYFIILEKLRDELAGINKVCLDEKTKSDFDIINEYIGEKLKLKDYILYFEPLSIEEGIQEKVPIFLAEFEIKSEEDIQKYFDLLSGIDEYYQSIIEFERKKSEAGLFMTDVAAELLLETLEKYILSPKSNLLSNAFKYKLKKLDLSKAKVSEYENMHDEILETDFVNAYEILKKGIQELKGLNTNTGFSESIKEYRTKRIEAFLGSAYKDIESLKIKLQDSIEKNLFVLSALSLDESLNKELLNNYHLEAGSAAEAVDFLKLKLAKNFENIDKYDYNILPMHGEFLNVKGIIIKPFKFDEPENVVYIKEEEGLSLETYEELTKKVLPGELYLLNCFRNNTDNPLRFLFKNDNFIKGWNIYALKESYKADDRLAEKEKEYLASKTVLKLGIYAYLDLQINYYAVNKDFVSTYLKKHYNISDETAINNIYNNISARPLLYLQRYVSYMEIEKLKETVKKSYGEKFTDKDFHILITKLGPVSFDRLRAYVNSRLLLIK